MLDPGELTLNCTFLSVLFCFVSPPLHLPALKTQGEASNLCPQGLGIFLACVSKIHLRAEVKLLLGSKPEKGKVSPSGLATCICLTLAK